MTSLFFLYVGGLWFCCFLTGSQRKNSEATRSQKVPLSNHQYFSAMLVSMCVMSVFFSQLFKREKNICESLLV